MKRILPALVLSLALSACGTKAPPPGPAAVPVQRIYGSDALRSDFSTLFQEPYADTQAVRVFFATNRELAGEREGCSDAAFGTRTGFKTFYGACRINVPKRHGVGALDVGPTPRADSNRFFRVLGHEKFAEQELLSSLKETQPADLLLFVHGFNVRFQEALFRASQIAYDLKFQGPVVLFSWPAGAEAGFISETLLNKVYETNRGAARRSVPPLADFLAKLEPLGAKIHVLVHSMGHQVILPALARLTLPEERRLFGELILNAPDIGLEEFHDLLPKLKRSAERITVYCSYNDNAIAASETFNQERRMGGCEQMPGIDVINVGEIDAPTLGIGGLGHGYYASRPILTDIFQVLLGIPAENRLFIRKSEPNSVENYYLRP